MGVYVFFSLLVLIAYPISVYKLIKSYHHRRRSNGEHSIWLPVALMPVLACILSYITVVGFLAGLGPGMFMMLCAIPFSLVSLFMHFFSGRDSQKVKNDVLPLKWGVRLLVFVLVLSMSLAPLIGYIGISSACFYLHAALAEPIIVAVHAYQADKGMYPPYLEALTPEYLKRIPKPICLYLNPVIPFMDSRAYTLEQNNLRYHLHWCSSWNTHQTTGEKPIISVMNVALGFPQRYDFETGKWSSISKFDGVCSFLV